MDVLFSYWSHAELVTNGLILLHLLGALAVGMLMGYERSYHGRAAGMRTYGLVCLAATVLTVVNAYPGMWYGGMGPHGATGAGDPTRVIQGIVTGIGFLGAGVIMREGMSIRGLSTAASIWATAAIGVTIGLGFYLVAVGAALISVFIMTMFRRLEARLPHQTVIRLSLVFPCDKAPSTDDLRAQVKAHGFEVIDWSFHLRNDSNQFECQLMLQANGLQDPMSLIGDLSKADSLIEFSLSPSRM